jgi:O-antigen/teichoic acid export membrane protein
MGQSINFAKSRIKTSQKLRRWQLILVSEILIVYLFPEFLTWLFGDSDREFYFTTLVLVSIIISQLFYFNIQEFLTIKNHLKSIYIWLSAFEISFVMLLTKFETYGIILIIISTIGLILKIDEAIKNTPIKTI